MKLIKELVELIDEEVDGAEHYAKMSLIYKEDNPSLAKTVLDISNDEMRHVDMLHSEVVKLIEEHRRTHGEPPAPMMAVYNYMHEKHIEKANKVRLLQNEYKK